MEKLKKGLKKGLLKFPPLYRGLANISKKIKGIDSKKDGVDGEELKFLLENMGKNKLVMEIGVFSGETTQDLAKENFVVAIDPFVPDNELGTLQGDYPQDVYLRFMGNTLGKNVLFLPMTSQKAFDLWDKFVGKEIDSIFVDGLHTYDAVKIDFKWIKFLKKGGKIMFHDTEIPGVKKFLDESVFTHKGFKFVSSKYSVKVFEKIN